MITATSKMSSTAITDTCGHGAKNRVILERLQRVYRKHQERRAPAKRHPHCNPVFPVAVIATPTAHKESGRARLHSLRKNWRMRAAPWKSGPSGPRKPVRISDGFKPLWQRFVVQARFPAVC